MRTNREYGCGDRGPLLVNKIDSIGARNACMHACIQCHTRPARTPNGRFTGQARVPLRPAPNTMRSVAACDACRVIMQADPGAVEGQVLGNAVGGGESPAGNLLAQLAAERRARREGSSDASAASPRGDAPVAAVTTKAVELLGGDGESSIGQTVDSVDVGGGGGTHSDGKGDDSEGETTAKAAAGLAPNSAAADDVDDSEERDLLDCSICFRLMLEPVSLTCGHTYCRRCLKSALRVNQNCPMCRAPTFSTAHTQPVNRIIQQLIEKRFPAELKERQEEEVTEAEEDRFARVPVFLQTMLLFPNQPVTFFMFEPRYLIMVQRCMESDRRFALLPAMDAQVGIMVEIASVRRHTAGRLLIEARAKERFTIRGRPTEEANTHGLLYAEVAEMGDVPATHEQAAEIQRYRQALSETCFRMQTTLPVAHARRVEKRHGTTPTSDAENLSLWAAGALAIPDDVRLTLFTARDTLLRLRACYAFLKQLDDAAKPPAAAPTGESEPASGASGGDIDGAAAPIGDETAAATAVAGGDERTGAQQGAGGAGGDEPAAIEPLEHVSGVHAFEACKGSVPGARQPITSLFIVVGAIVLLWLLQSE